MFAPKLVVHDGTVIFAGGEKTHMSYMGWGSDDIGQDTMTAFSAETGQKLWTAASPFSGYNSPEDLFVARGKVWTGTTAIGGPGGRYVGRDLATGLLDDDFLRPDLRAELFHDHATTDGRPTGFGLGWNTLHDAEGRPVIHKTGGGPGISAWVVIYPEQRFVFAAAANYPGSIPGAVWITEGIGGLIDALVAGEDPAAAPR